MLLLGDIQHATVHYPIRCFLRHELIICMMAARKRGEEAWGRFSLTDSLLIVF